MSGSKSKKKFRAVAGGYSLIVALGLSLLIFVGATQAASTNAPADQKVNPELATFMERFDEPRLIRLGEAGQDPDGRVLAAFAFDYSNFGFVIGDDGIIAIDTGWFPHKTEMALAELRKISDKPIKAIIYTHPHPDHIGGAALIAEQAVEDVPIYAPAGWRERFKYDGATFYPMIVRRGLAQMGVMLPHGPEGTVGTGIGPSPDFSSVAHALPATVTVDQPLEVTIAGVRLEMIPAPGDIESHMVVWLPDDKVLFPGDVTDGVFPSVASPRYEPDRDSSNWVNTLEKVMDLSPSAMVNGHGRITTSAEDSREMMQTRIDLVRFLRDQVDRYVNKNYSADQVIESLEFPDELAGHPDLQPYYHRIPWLIRQMVMKRAGFASGPLSLVRHSEGNEAERWIAAVGGVEEMLEHARQALEEDDPRWSATLASYVLMADPDNEQARALRHKSLRRIASTTESTSERNYVLTAIAEDENRVPWKKVYARIIRQQQSERPSAGILSELRARFRAEKAGDAEFRVNVEIAGETGQHCLTVRRQSLRHDDSADACEGGHISLTREGLLALHSGERSLWELVDQGEGEIHAKAELVETLSGLLEPPMNF